MKTNKWQHNEVNGRTVSTLGSLQKVFANELKVGETVRDLVVTYKVLDVCFVEGTAILELAEIINGYQMPSKIVEKPYSFRYSLV